MCSPVPTSKAPRFRLVALFSPLPIATRHPHCTRLLHYRRNLEERVSLTPTASSLLLSLCLTHFFHGSPRHPSNSPTTSSPDRTHRLRCTGRGLQGKSSRGYAVYAHFGCFGSAILSSGLDSLLSVQRGYLERCSIGPDCPACVREFSKSGPAQQVGACWVRVYRQLVVVWGLVTPPVAAALVAASTEASSRPCPLQSHMPLPLPTRCSGDRTEAAGLKQQRILLLSLPRLPNLPEASIC